MAGGLFRRWRHYEPRIGEVGLVAATAAAGRPRAGRHSSMPADHSNDVAIIASSAPVAIGDHAQRQETVGPSDLTDHAGAASATAAPASKPADTASPSP